MSELEFPFHTYVRFQFKAPADPARAAPRLECMLYQMCGHAVVELGPEHHVVNVLFKELESVSKDAAEALIDDVASYLGG